MKIIITLLLLFGIIAATVIPALGLSDGNVAFVEDGSAPAVEDNRHHISVTATAIARTSLSNGDAASVMNAFAHPSTDDNIIARAEHSQPPLVPYWGPTPGQCDRHHEICKHTYIQYKVNDRKLDRICECATAIWEKSCMRFGYTDCTYVTDTWGVDGVADAAGIASGGLSDADFAESVAAIAVTADNSGTDDSHADIPATETAWADTTPSDSNTESKVTARQIDWYVWPSKEACQHDHARCKRGWICTADPTNCDRLCNCYVGIWDRTCYDRYGYGVCVHGNRFQAT